MNLAIRRIVFAAIRKRTTGISKPQLLPVRSVKQIAGRAGRFGVKQHETGAEDASGLVTGIDPECLAFVRKAMYTENKPLEVAQQDCDIDLLRRLKAICAPNAAWADLVALAVVLGITERPFVVSGLIRLLDQAESVSTIQDLTLLEYNLFTGAPVPHANALASELLLQFARSKRDNVVFDLEGWFRKHLNESSPHAGAVDEIGRLESLYSITLLYRWLANRDPLAFPHLRAAISMSNECNERITQLVDDMTHEDAGRHLTDMPKRPSGETASKRRKTQPVEDASTRKWTEGADSRGR